ncbi:flagellar hook-length control protein FliK [Pseudoalteromonas ruthenica]|uniref:flagellar hook-length control protein FliK n=1 Tax=Pseudoalteromonas ruthenica TaxID=151081 RepID=UPI0009E3B50E|nr:flagellar hook-length control protein FliK [Pseudoalteromonas ruthenica]TMO93358.1 flagellar hook-length control protein FliK [Pseudoalteromonas ruthenica]TMP00110.1 flagellar hook-length control protein FliK [Pseudoalteromonas ruthenica]TMP06020.1 flagellar hook-length control protein FliK [Pseudoalteromonas ruthenica]TMP09430.1 flagellar hook-length control protein FliK [Pseudoalteromonas ruthenica]
MMTQVESVIVLPQSGQSQDKGASSTYDSGEKEFAQFYSQEQQRQDRVKRSPEDEKQAIGGFVGQKSDSKEPQKKTQEAEQGVDKSAKKVNEQSRDKEPSTTVLDGEGDAADDAEPLSNRAQPSDEVAQTTPIAASEDDFYQQLFAQLSMSTELSAVAKEVGSALNGTGFSDDIDVDFIAKLPIELKQSLARLTPAQRSELSVQLQQMASAAGIDAKALASIETQLNQLVATPGQSGLSDAERIAAQAKELSMAKASEQVQRPAESVAARSAEDASKLNNSTKVASDVQQELNKVLADGKALGAEAAKSDAKNSTASAAPGSINPEQQQRQSQTQTQHILAAAKVEADQGGPSASKMTQAAVNPMLSDAQMKAAQPQGDKQTNLSASKFSAEPMIESGDKAVSPSKGTQGENAQPSANALSAQSKVTQLASALVAHAQGNTELSSAIEADLAHWQQVQQAAMQSTQHTQAQGQTQRMALDPALLQAINITKNDAAQQIQQRVNMMLNLNNQEAEIRLDPPELGSMQVRVRSEGEQAHVNFVVQNQQAKEALEQAMPRLRDLLAQQGLSLGDTNVEQQNQQSAQHDGEQGQGSEHGPLTEQASNDENHGLEQQQKNAPMEQGIDFYA